jgi:hypothetical protein
MLCFLRKMKRVGFFPKINVPGVLYIRREIEIVARALLRYGTLDNDQITELWPLEQANALLRLLREQR